MRSTPARSVPTHRAWPSCVWPARNTATITIWVKLRPFGAGCIIRARFLNAITAAFNRDADLTNLFLDQEFRQAVIQRLPAWRKVVQLAVGRGIPVPAFSASLAYYDSYRSERLPANLTQGQRDYFGAHTYERVDKPGSFHYPWEF
ncbi:MAG: hypothetical protein R2873_14905 [Caldilineaceae bacterium]